VKDGMTGVQVFRNSVLKAIVEIVLKFIGPSKALESKVGSCTQAEKCLRSWLGGEDINNHDGG
jgi:hypothetical protein